MKKSISLVLVVISIAVAISGCGFDFGNTGNPGSSGTTSSNENGNESISITDIVAAFKPPASVTGIDFNADDPTNDDIRFTFDAAGRIDYAYYSLNGFDVVLGYVYESEALDDDVSLWIIGFIDGVVVADERLQATNSTFDDSIGFLEHKGYFIKGFAFT